MGTGNLLRSLDEGLTEMLASWNSYSTGLATVLIGMVIYRVVTLRDPDVHPLLLARQAEHNRIRMPGESPIYHARYTERLTTGLNVRDPPAPGQRSSAWSRGRDGDLRDLWRQVLLGAEPVARLGGPVQGDGEVQRKKGRLVTVLGSTVVESKLEVVDHQITAIGKYLASKGAKRVAIYLPNSIEFAAALFACSFQLITPILVPFDQPPATLISMLRDAGADTVIAVPGVFPVDAVAAALQDLRHVIWVADEGNMHLDWDDAPADHIDVATWHDIVAATPKQEDEGGHDKQAVPPEVVTFWTTRDAASGNEKHQVVAFSQANLVAAIAGQAESLPAMTPEDVVLPADSLASAHTLVVTLAALFSNASVAFNAAACRHPDLAQLTDPDVLCPSIIIASPTTLVKAHADYITKLGSSLFARFSHWSLTKSLLHDGRMPSSSVAGRGVVGAGLRLIITADRAGSGMTPALSPSILSDLRISTGARIVYALTASPVAGAVAQTMAFDYRVAEGESKPHFGGPPRCLRYMLKDTPAVKNSDEKYQGDIFVQGPCVAGGEASLGVVGTVRSDNTLAYA